ncbi:MAG: hypothetical protein PVI06_15190 [Desulfobacterales bacterium]|jgi:hypothetical protein
MEHITKAQIMGLGTRIFIANDNDTLKRMPIMRYHRLFKRDPEERFLEYAGNRIRYVLVALEFKNRKPAEILRIQYSYLAFDQKGRLREDERERAARLSMEMIKPSPPEENPNRIIDAGYKFAKKQFDREFRWEPSPETEAAIFKAIFG